ncbi:hypothetical protein PENSPDRAFT_735222 [Peniophora sp. CONT]|nr:hypothetical protein PENSPDRAFT_735222 [Peniophora sp. CONT]
MFSLLPCILLSFVVALQLSGSLAAPQPAEMRRRIRDGYGSPPPSEDAPPNTGCMSLVITPTSTAVLQNEKRFANGLGSSLHGGGSDDKDSQESGANLFERTCLD